MGVSRPYLGVPMKGATGVQFLSGVFNLTRRLADWLTLRTDIASERFVVTFDEPENHLHPALQRTLLPTLSAAFPQVQFIVATHSPFMVSSMKDSAVYVLRYQDAELEIEESSGSIVGSRRVQSVRLD